MGHDVFIDRDLIVMMNKLVVFLSKRHEDEGKAFGINMDVMESFHHFSARLHKLGKRNRQAFNGLFDRQGAGIDSIGRQFRYQFLTGLGYGKVACQAQEELGANFKGRNPETKGNLLPAGLHGFGDFGNPNQIGIGLKADA